jgi:flagellar FliL protein
MASAAKAKAKVKVPEVEPDDEEEKEEGEASAEQSKRKLLGFLTLKSMIIGGAALLILCAGGGAAYFFLFAHSKEPKVAAVPGKPVVFVDLPDVLVNLSNAGTDRTQYLKVKIVLELPDQLMIAQIQPVMPRVMDAFQTYLRELRASDLDGSAGLYRLKEELTRRVNASIAPNKINAVLFKEIVVQ